MTSVNNIEFKSRVFVSGTITALTGLHIGGSSVEMSIGGADSIVIRDPITNYPYIPGSSLRGKMRSLFEKARGEMTFTLEGEKEAGKSKKSINVTDVEKVGEYISKGFKLAAAGPSTEASAVASNLFGVPVDKQEDESPIPQRLVIRDAKLANPEKLENAKNTDMPLTEVKTEVAIDRITSKANPRQIERVPAGAKFDFEFILNLYGDDKLEEYLDHLFECMELLQDDYLGGHGSRGYGKIAFNVKSVAQRTAEDYRNGRPPREMTDIKIPECLVSSEDTN